MSKPSNQDKKSGKKGDPDKFVMTGFTLIGPDGKKVPLVVEEPKGSEEKKAKKGFGDILKNK